MTIMSGHAEHSEQAQGRLAEDRQAADRQAEVWACLQGVTDPELDESVTELNFVSRVDVDPENRVFFLEPVELTIKVGSFIADRLDG